MEGASGRTYDVAVIGAGIVGCAAAYYLAREGVKVAIFDRGRVAGEQSSRAWGFVRQQGRHSAEVPLAAAASRLWGEIETELGADVEFVRSGILVAAETEADEERLVASERIARAHGLDSRMLSRSEMRSILPDAPPAWRSGLYTAADGHAEPEKATRAYADAARRAGVSIHEYEPVLRVRTSNGRVTGIVTADGEYEAGAILCAAGIGAADLSRTIGLSLPIQIVRACVAQTNPTALRSAVAVWSPHVAYRPKRDGTLYVGNGYRGVDAECDVTLESFRHLKHFIPTLLVNWRVIRIRFGSAFFQDLRRRLPRREPSNPLPEPPVTCSLIRYNEKKLYDAFPELRGVGIARTWAGRIDATPDLIPIIDCPGTPANYYIAAGFNGHGFALGPVVGKLISEMIARGKTSFDLHRFRLSRFAEGEARPQSNAL